MIRNENFFILLIDTVSNLYLLPLFLLFIATLFFFFLLDLTTVIAHYFNTKHAYLNLNNSTAFLNVFIKNLTNKTHKKLFFKKFINLIF